MTKPHAPACRCWVYKLQGTSGPGALPPARCSVLSGLWAAGWARIHGSHRQLPTSCQPSSRLASAATPIHDCHMGLAGLGFRQDKLEPQRNGPRPSRWRTPVHNVSEPRQPPARSAVFSQTLSLPNMVTRLTYIHQSANNSLLARGCCSPVALPRCNRFPVDDGRADSLLNAP